MCTSMTCKLLLNVVCLLCECKGTRLAPLFLCEIIISMKTPDIIYGGMDGVITTLTMVMAGSAAELKPAAILTVGLAKVIADAYSMAVGRYLSEPDSRKEAIMTFVAFVVAGMMPLVPYILGIRDPRVFSLALAMVSFWYLGQHKGIMLGASAAGLSYIIAKNIH